VLRVWAKGPLGIDSSCAHTGSLEDCVGYRYCKVCYMEGGWFTASPKPGRH